MAKKRLDALIVDLGLLPSRQQAQRVIRAGEVRVNQSVVDKPGTEVDEAAQIEVRQPPPFVSRGGEKLLGALQAFAVLIPGRICLDGGISTGGFTDCLLQHGAAQVYGVDVGYGQVAWSLRTDPRVILRERTNLRYLKPEELYNSEAPRPGLGVVDVSFISLTQVLEALWGLLVAPRELLLLVKPQFEAGRSQVGKNGVVRDRQVQAQAIRKVLSRAQELGWCYRGVALSPLEGPAGNREYWLWLHTESESAIPDLDVWIQSV
ncbi:TlyA family RNA methyltransferase [Leptolyngbya sp. FACHB-261]|uniref:TlyA family RNA methyltransferase n=1 Tax=Leptolyngbya sp. FACHB-261 TaxID=2692806 RepID=UPI00168A195C|nr:TlyA family RNA methyltransferase [Leptolyngbya sp. FACHB-261]MBD2104628.1 TlyA family RNA methyltransferase [Leptolyngbya sp. FACHB-261]